VHKKLLNYNSNITIPLLVKSIYIINIINESIYYEFFITIFFGSAEISNKINIEESELLVKAIKKVKREKGRIFF